MKKRLLPLLLILLLAGLLAPFLADFMAETVIGPLLYFLWVGRLLLASVPQLCLWSLFLLLVLVIALSSLGRPRLSFRRTRQPQAEPTNRIEGWINLLQGTEEEIYYKWQLAQHLRDLTLNILADQRQLTPGQTRRLLQAGRLELPPDIQRYLEASLVSFSHFTAPPSLHWPGREPPAPATPLDLAPERIIQYLEDQFDYRGSPPGNPHHPAS